MSGNPLKKLLPPEALPWLLSALALLLFPAVFQSSSAITIMNQMAITIVFALSYNMLLGQGGMLSFGHAVYMGLGGFMCIHLLNYVEYEEWWIPLPLLPFLGGLFGLLFALLIGYFSTRRAGTVFAMISLGIGELVAACSIIIVVFFGGEEGVSGDRTYGPTLFGYDFSSQKEVYYLTAIWLLIAALGMYLFSRTPVGRMANAVRDNPERAEFLGYSQRAVRYYSFCISGFFAGVAGGLFAINYEILTEENLNLATSGNILLVTFLGGVGHFIGPVIGAVVFTLLQTVLSLKTEIWQLYVGILFVVTVMFFPSGLAGLLAMHAGPVRNGKLFTLLGPYCRTLLPGAIAALAGAGLLEMLFHHRHAATGEDTMSLIGIEFSVESFWPWAILALIAAAGIAIVRATVGGLRSAWQAANTPGNPVVHPVTDPVAKTAPGVNNPAGEPGSGTTSGSDTAGKKS
ncbi:ABC transporter permease [Chromatiales bacterium (ex Bugula neritina AB1)]|nr:ABC transporter permease [Chromatiales bacterium (ex Bugula neritina AB1)]